MKYRTFPTYSLDLHGTRHQDVFTKVDRFIGEHLLKGTPAITIITGHSPEMKKRVQSVLDQYEMYGQEGVINTGQLTIDLT
jgi:dsDNA-specific endonuclease/ATPase MutS2